MLITLDTKFGTVSYLGGQEDDLTVEDYLSSLGMLNEFFNDVIRRKEARRRSKQLINKNIERKKMKKKFNEFIELYNRS
jgi:hypothetical protein